MELSPEKNEAQLKLCKICHPTKKQAYFSTKEKKQCLTCFSRSQAESEVTFTSPRLLLLPPFPLPRFRTIRAFCRGETEMLREMTHPQPDCDTATKKQFGTRAICLFSQGLNPQGNLLSLRTVFPQTGVGGTILHLDGPATVVLPAQPQWEKFQYLKFGNKQLYFSILIQKWSYEQVTFLP